MAIAAVNGSTINNSTAGTSIAFAAASQTSGNRIVVAVAILTTTVSVSSITDGTNTFTLQSSTNNGTAVRVELWACTIASSATRTITVNFTGGSTLASAAYEQYSGSTAIGNIATATTGASIYPEVDVATQDANNWSIAALAVATNSGDTFANDLGTQRQKVIPALTTASIVLVDNTSQLTVAGLRNAVQASTSRSWACAALELRTGQTAISAVVTNVLLLSGTDSGAKHQIVTAPAPYSSIGGGGGGNSGYIG